MFYIIIGLPLAAVFAALQFLLCEKGKTNLIKLLPFFASAASFLLAAFIRGENFIGDAVYGIFGQGIFALIVLLWISGGAAGIGALIGRIIYFIKRR